MYIKKLDPENKRIEVALPLTSPSSKIRIKERNNHFENGLPFAASSKVIHENCYIEWQIGYYVLVNNLEKAELSRLKNEITFKHYKKEKKCLYELSEYIYYFYQWNFIKKKDLQEIIQRKIQSNHFIDTHHELTVDRTNRIEKKINHLDFYYSQIKYPLLVYTHGVYKIITEITIKEKQYAIGNQPMLYFCIPIEEIQPTKENQNLIGRTTNIKEEGLFIIDENNYQIFLKMMDIFSLLSEKHCLDVKEILTAILNEREN